MTLGPENPLDLIPRKECSLSLYSITPVFHLTPSTVFIGVTKHGDGSLQLRRRWRYPDQTRTLNKTDYLMFIYNTSVYYLYHVHVTPKKRTTKTQTYFFRLDLMTN